MYRNIIQHYICQWSRFFTYRNLFHCIQCLKSVNNSKFVSDVINQGILAYVPNMVYLLFKCGCAEYRIKNWLALVSGPLFAIATIPRLSWLFGIRSSWKGTELTSSLDEVHRQKTHPKCIHHPYLCQ